MSTIDPSLRRRRKPRRRWPKLVAGLIAVLVVFAAGYGVGRALDDNPTPTAPVTTIRELQPLPAVTTS